MNNQLIAVWGSPGSGKTTISAKLARWLAGKQKTVVLVLCDLLCPSLPVLLPKVDPKEKSLGALLSNPDLDQGALLAHLTLPQGDYLGVVGYKKGENFITYPQYLMEQALDLLVLLRHRVDYVIVDCSSDLTDDNLSVAALRNADQVLRCGTADLKGLSFFDAQLPVMAMDHTYGVDKHLKAISAYKPFSPKAEVAEAYGGVDFQFPYAAELEHQFWGGELLEPVKSKEGKLFMEGIKKLAKEVFDE
ncbi:hypothetical protein [Desulfitobacterium chlororespirans]|uniref:CobQ/CobB/MinD/ParA nucleotide binding domain-containing protein n=1 Tax=Desulfitobacterium chlororespirans DSM 11544 TaxID=1121395 RepID=A0A1M7UXZ7_9FIRM|nr:hypothetical protein [Desulfitobacterium chlororespirans]SHN87911.1 CobQ/CobB/MinD/ParA nucleotide binding domain-containing protein [Desulfitobacterium chlororespirans DSM 11544]